jgi:hypothetical protein
MRLVETILDFEIPVAARVAADLFRYVWKTMKRGKKDTEGIEIIKTQSKYRYLNVDLDTERTERRILKMQGQNTIGVSKCIPSQKPCGP